MDQGELERTNALFRQYQGLGIVLMAIGLSLAVLYDTNCKQERKYSPSLTDEQKYQQMVDDRIRYEQRAGKEKIERAREETIQRIRNLPDHQ